MVGKSFWYRSLGGALRGVRERSSDRCLSRLADDFLNRSAFTAENDDRRHADAGTGIRSEGLTRGLRQKETRARRRAVACKLCNGVCPQVDAGNSPTCDAGNHAPAAR